MKGVLAMGKKKWGENNPLTWGIDDGQLQHSEQHEPVVDVKVRMGLKGETVSQGKRRAADARVFDSLTPEQSKALKRIIQGYSLTTNGYGCGGLAFDEPDPSGRREMSLAEQAEWEMCLRAAYWSWHTECVKRRLHPAVALDFVVFGMTLTESAEARSMCRKTLRNNLFSCLNVYCELNGWSKANADEEGWAVWFPWLVQWLKRA